MELKENDAVEISIYDGKMMIEKISRPGYRDLKERLEAFYQKPIDEIYVDGTQEAEAGNPAGKE
jgi:antitoxin MazE